MKTVIIIPSRMASQRFPNKPMALIDGIPMIQRVWKQAIESNIGQVIVACCEKEVFQLINSLGGEAIMTRKDHPSGTDRIFEVIKNYPTKNQIESIINLQGDMPIINPETIKKVNIPLAQGFEIGTLITNLSSAEEKNENITKAKIDWIKKNNLGEAKDFYKKSKNELHNIYHHVGIYSYRYESLEKFVGLKPSYNEVNNNLEQLRALDANMKIGVTYVEGVPLSVDTKEDLLKVENIINISNE